jgi:hypothetical protein
MEDLLSLLREIHRLVQLNGLDERMARITATKSLASRGVTEQTIRDAYTPRRGSGGAASFDTAVGQWIRGNPEPISELLLRVAQGSEDQSAVRVFIASGFSAMVAPSAGLVQHDVALKKVVSASADDGDQGLVADSKIRKAIEDRAMQLAEEYYRRRFFSVENTAKTEPFDFRCKNGTDEVRVEVKGSMGRANQVLVTIGEVDNASGTAWRTDLFIAGNIRVVQTPCGPVGEGGTVRVIEA